MLAPIALYPDALLAQMLAAAAFPLEVAEADRFVRENQGLKGKALLEAAKDKNWEPGVKAMLEFPEVLAMMDEQLEWTKKLGDAFLAQQGDCLDAVQLFREFPRGRFGGQGIVTGTAARCISTSRLDRQTRSVRASKT